MLTRLGSGGVALTKWQRRLGRGANFLRGRTRGVHPTLGILLNGIGQRSQPRLVRPQFQTGLNRLERRAAVAAIAPALRLGHQVIHLTIERRGACRCRRPRRRRRLLRRCTRRRGGSRRRGRVGGSRLRGRWLDRRRRRGGAGLGRRVVGCRLSRWRRGGRHVRHGLRRFGRWRSSKNEVPDDYQQHRRCRPAVFHGIAAEQRTGAGRVRRRAKRRRPRRLTMQRQFGRRWRRRW